MPEPQTLNLPVILVQDLSPEDLLTNLIYGRKAMAFLKAMDDAMLDRLDELAEAGEIDRGGFSHNDWGFSWSAGKKAYVYPANVQELEEKLNAAREAAKAAGTATTTTGAPFWTIRRLGS
jgi:hypothetical protein